MAQEGPPPGHRPFTAQALRGELTFTAWPEARLNDQPVRLAPGARLRGPDNLLLNTGHGSLGFTLAFGTAAQVAELLAPA